MKYKTKSIEVEADKANNVNYYVDDIGFIEISQFDKLFEPVEDESEKQETFICGTCCLEFSLNSPHREFNNNLFCENCFKKLGDKYGFKA